MSTRVVSWKLAALKKESVAREAFVMPRRIGFATAGKPPSAIIRVFANSKTLMSINSPGKNSVSPLSSIFILCNICRTITSMCLSFISTP